MFHIEIDHSNQAPLLLQSTRGSSLGGGADPLTPIVVDGQPALLSYQGVRPLAKIKLECSLSEIFAPTVLAESQWELNTKQPFDNCATNNNYGKNKLTEHY